MNMAIDEALLENVNKNGGPPVFRLYGFDPPTLSIGRFQKIKTFHFLEILENNKHVLVRRPTGGWAVLHDNELTYSVILGREHLVPFNKRSVYRFIARILLEGLKNLGITADINYHRTGSLHNPDCFATKGEYEIRSHEGRKIIGSAQVTTRYAALQHGSIPLDDSYREIDRYFPSGDTPGYEPPSSLSREAGSSISFNETRKAFKQAITKILNFKISDLYPAESKAAEKFMIEKYSKDSWNWRS